MSRAEIIRAYERYLEASLADDIATIDALVQYPLAYIGDGKVDMLDDYPIRPSALMAAKRWHTSVDVDRPAPCPTRRAAAHFRSGTLAKGGSR